MEVEDKNDPWVVEWCSSGDQKGLFHVQNLSDTIRANLNVFLGRGAARYASPWLIVGVFEDADKAHDFATKLQAAQDRGVLGGYRDDDRLLIPATENHAEVERLKRIPYKEYLRSLHWQNIRKEALAKAKYRCQVCNSGGNLEVHHRTYANRGEEREGDVLVLCDGCHGTFHKTGTLIKD